MAKFPAYAPFSMDVPVEVIRMVRGRTVRTEGPLFAKCVHTMAGTGLLMTLGEPPSDDGPFLAAAPLTDDDEATLKECRAALEASLEDGDVHVAAGDDAEKLDPATWTLLITMAVKFIQALIEKRRNP